MTRINTAILKMVHVQQATAASRLFNRVITLCVALCINLFLTRFHGHPVNGRPILFVNPMHTHGFSGMTREEAWPLIEELAEHATQERFVYYHRWRVGDVLMWDERATMHRGAGDYRPEERRIMLRTIVYLN